MLSPNLKGRWHRHPSIHPSIQPAIPSKLCLSAAQFRTLSTVRQRQSSFTSLGRARGAAATWFCYGPRLLPPLLTLQSSTRGPAEAACRGERQRAGAGAHLFCLFAPSRGLSAGPHGNTEPSPRSVARRQAKSSILPGGEPGGPAKTPRSPRSVRPVGWSVGIRPGRRSSAATAA